jgi:hypothetical protein
LVVGLLRLVIEQVEELGAELQRLRLHHAKVLAREKAVPIPGIRFFEFSAVNSFQLLRGTTSARTSGYIM